MIDPFQKSLASFGQGCKSGLMKKSEIVHFF